jgi:hypothetical protein
VSVEQRRWLKGAMPLQQAQSTYRKAYFTWFEAIICSAGTAKRTSEVLAMQKLRSPAAPSTMLRLCVHSNSYGSFKNTKLC